jgi:hypothetical protein
MEGFARLRLALKRANAVGVGCHYWSLAEYGAPVEQLELLGLAKSIKARVPTCEDHGCHLLETCRHRIVFAEARPGRSGRKFRLTPEGVAAIDSPAEIAARVAELPLARRILDMVAASPEPITGFDLYWRLLEPELDELARTGEPAVHKLTRPAVRFYLDLLIASGWLLEDHGRIRPP